MTVTVPDEKETEIDQVINFVLMYNWGDMKIL